MTAALDVWWGTSLVATVEQRRGRIMTRYAPAADRMLSVAMPVRTKPYGEKESRPFFHGLLPEGETRRAIAYDLGFGARGGDDVELLAAIGRDCAGALVVLPSGSDAPTATPGTLESLADHEVAERIRDLPLNPLGVDDRVRVSLPGVQNKLLLARTSDGRWALPLDGAPSTHILKPAIHDLPGSVDNEHLCQAVAAAAGVPAAGTAKAVFGGMSVLVSERFDRHAAAPDGTVARLHQEDACQALSVLTVPAERKYQADPSRPPSFRGIAQVLDQWGDTGASDALVDQMTLSVVLGNADLHGKNLTLVHRGGLVELSPAYDLMSTTGLSRSVSTNMGMYVNGKRNIHAVTAEDLVGEAAGWGVRSSADVRVRSLLERLPEAVEEAAGVIGDVPDSLVDHLFRRAVEARDGSAGVHVVPTTARSAAPGRSSGAQRCGSTNTRTGKPCRNPAGCTVPGHDRR